MIVRSLRLLPVTLGPAEIRACAYRYRVRAGGETDVEIAADGTTALLRSSTEEQLERDYSLLLEIIEGSFAGRARGGARPVIRLQRASTRAPTRPDAVLRSPAISRDRDGRLALRGAAARLLAGLDARLVALAEGFGAEPVHAEPLWSREALQRFGHRDESPHLMRIAPPAPGDPGYWQNAVCNNVWMHHAGLVVGDAPLVLTARGTCCRHEGDQHFAFEVLRAFTMRELMIAGPPPRLLELRERIEGEVTALADELELRGALCEASDPFFLVEGAAAGDVDLPEVVKIELRLDLYDDRTLAVASFNVHGDFFARRLGIRGQGPDAAVWTGCVAFGLERWVWAILIQHGPDPGAWPAPVRALAGVG